MELINWNLAVNQAVKSSLVRASAAHLTEKQALVTKSLLSRQTLETMDLIIILLSKTNIKSAMK